MGRRHRAGGHQRAMGITRAFGPVAGEIAISAFAFPAKRPYRPGFE